MRNGGFGLSDDFRHFKLQGGLDILIFFDLGVELVKSLLEFSDHVVTHLFELNDVSKSEVLDHRLLRNRHSLVDQL